MEGPEWLEERRKGIGGSDVAAILGISPWKTAFQVYQEKRKEVVDWQGSPVTDWGTLVEPSLRQWYSNYTGREVFVPNKILASAKYPFMLASPDGLTKDERVVEAKTSMSSVGWGEPGTGQIPDYYQVQCQHYMIVTGFHVTDVPVSIAGGPPQLYTVNENPELQQIIIEECQKFWKRVEEGDPPPLASYSDAVRRYGTSLGQGRKMATEEIEVVVKEISKIKAERDALAKREEDLSAKVIEFIGDDADVITDVHGNALASYRITKGKVGFKFKKLMAEEPETYIKYLKTGAPSRRLIIKKE